MKTLEKKNPKIRKAISELKTISLSEKNRQLYEMRLKAELDYASNMEGAYEDGVLAGIEKGIEKGVEQGIERGIEQGREEGYSKARESLYLGIQLTLESRFNSKGLALMAQIKKIKDLDLLKKIMELSIKCNDLSEVKKVLKK